MMLLGNIILSLFYSRLLQTAITAISPLISTMEREKTETPAAMALGERVAPLSGLSGDFPEYYLCRGIRSELIERFASSEHSDILKCLYSNFN